jgi:hypothetical protein
MSRLRFAVRPRVSLVGRLSLLFALAAITVLVLNGAIDPLQPGLLTMLPAIALALVMATRPYLGERIIARLRARSRRRSNTTQGILTAVRRATDVPRGGLLIAVAMAGRAPPLALAGCR